MIKRLIVICITIISSCAYGQTGTASPYSFYGIGTLKAKGTIENRSMGGMGVYLDSIHVNLRNPAAYAGKNIESNKNNQKSELKILKSFGIKSGEDETTHINDKERGPRIYIKNSYTPV